MQASIQPTANPKFNLGNTVMTHGVACLFGSTDLAHTKACELLGRHHCGDWGDVSADSKVANEEAVRDKDQILSSYTVHAADNIQHNVWVITDPGHHTTTVLLPSEW